VGCRQFFKDQHIYYRIKYGKDKAALAGRAQWKFYIRDLPHSSNGISGKSLD